MKIADETPVFVSRHLPFPVKVRALMMLTRQVMSAFGQVRRLRPDEQNQVVVCNAASEFTKIQVIVPDV
jgi:hypothetical protein